MKKENKVQCAECPHPPPERACMTPGGKASKGCPTLGKKTLVKKAKEEYKAILLLNLPARHPSRKGSAILKERKGLMSCILSSRGFLRL